MLRAGERAGNAALEEVVMALALKGPTHFGEKGPTGSGPDLRTGIDPVHITPTSNMVKEYTGMAVQPHKAIVGANAFQHESGIHQDGMLSGVRQNRQRDHPAPSLTESTPRDPVTIHEDGRATRNPRRHDQEQADVRDHDAGVDRSDARRPTKWSWDCLREALGQERRVDAFERVRL